MPLASQTALKPSTDVIFIGTARHMSSSSPAGLGPRRMRARLANGNHSHNSVDAATGSRPARHSCAVRSIGPRRPAVDTRPAGQLIDSAGFPRIPRAASRGGDGSSPTSSVPSASRISSANGTRSGTQQVEQEQRRPRSRTASGSAARRRSASRALPIISALPPGVSTSTDEREGARLRRAQRADADHLPRDLLAALVADREHDRVLPVAAALADARSVPSTLQRRETLGVASARPWPPRRSCR